MTMDGLIESEEQPSLERFKTPHVTLTLWQIDQGLG